MTSTPGYQEAWGALMTAEGEADLSTLALHRLRYLEAQISTNPPVSDDLIALEKSAADTSTAKQYWKKIMITSTPCNQHNTLRQLSDHRLGNSQATSEEPDA